MIFALAELVLYTLKLGKYSKAHITKSGFVLAAPGLLGSAPFNQLQSADIIFYHNSRSLSSWAVMYYTGSFISHCATAVGDGLVVDVTTRGVIEHPISDYMNGRGFIAINRFPALDDAKRAKIKEFARSTIGGGFNWLGILKFWFAIITGLHRDYRIKFSIDLVLLWVLASILLLRLPRSPEIIVGFPIIAYGATVLAMIRIRKRRSKRQESKRPIARDAVEVPSEFFSAGADPNFTIIGLGIQHIEKLAEQLQRLAVSPERLKAELSAAGLSGYHVWAALKDNSIHGLLGARDLWSIAWGDHVLLQDLIARTDSADSAAATQSLLFHVAADADKRNRKFIYLERFKFQKQSEKSETPLQGFLTPVPAHVPKNGMSSS